MRLQAIRLCELCIWICALSATTTSLARRSATLHSDTSHGKGLNKASNFHRYKRDIKIIREPRKRYSGLLLWLSSSNTKQACQVSCCRREWFTGACPFILKCHRVGGPFFCVRLSGLFHPEAHYSRSTDLNWRTATPFVAYTQSGIGRKLGEYTLLGASELSTCRGKGR